MNALKSQKFALFMLFFVVAFPNFAYAGPYTAPGIPGHVPDPANPPATILNPELRAWGATVENYNPAPGLIPLHSDATKALGPIGSSPDGQTVSLGDLDAAQIAAGGVPGSITIGFAAPFRNQAGWDVAVFENAFRFFPPNDDKSFAELGYVEVSSDGLHFARFPSVSLTTPGTLYVPDFGTGPLRDFAGIDPTDVYNLAGAADALVGEPFDLADLSTHPFVVSGDLDLQAVRFVRLIDIPGDGSFLDSQGNGILDTWVTTDLTFGNGGFDLDAVAARYPVPEPATWMLAGLVMLVSMTKVARRRCMRQT
jgi:hypothetical protein